MTSLPLRSPSDRWVAVALWVTALCVVSMLVWILFDILVGALGSGTAWWSFLTTVPQDLGASGGIAPVLVSTGLLLAISLAVALPLGLGTAILLSETTTARGDNRLIRLVLFSLNVLAGVPSIVFGLFGSVVFCQLLGLGYSIAAGGLTLACMVLPIFVRTAEVGLREVPEQWRAGAAALGMSRAASLRHVVLPAALPSLAAGLVLSFGRALAETAALLFTAGAVLRMPNTALDSGRALSVHVYELSMFVPGGEAAAYRSAAVLVALLLCLNLCAAWIVRQQQKHGALNR